MVIERVGSWRRALLVSAVLMATVHDARAQLPIPGLPTTPNAKGKGAAAPKWSDRPIRAAEYILKLISPDIDKNREPASRPATAVLDAIVEAFLIPRSRRPRPGPETAEVVDSTA